MITTKAVMDRLPENTGTGPLTLAVLARFRREFHACLAGRADELCELADAVLCAEVMPGTGCADPPGVRGVSTSPGHITISGRLPGIHER